MLLSEAKLGDEVVIYVTEKESLSAVPTSKTMKATVIGVSNSGKDCVILGWRKGERPTICSMARNGGGFALNTMYTYLPNQGEFIYGRGGFIGDYDIASVSYTWKLGTPSKECPCGIFRADCTYHKVT